MFIPLRLFQELLQVAGQSEDSHVNGNYLYGVEDGYARLGHTKVSPLLIGRVKSGLESHHRCILLL